jgi:AcrR family transcriptional regulator
MTPAEETRGRPRDPGVDRLILEATMEHLLKNGFSDLSIEAVAASAGVGKTTIYRRYPEGKLDLVLDAITKTHVHMAEVPDEGSVRADLIALFGHPAAFQIISGPGSTILGTVLLERFRNPRLIENFRKAITDPRRRQFKAVVDRAKSRGEIREDVDSDLVGSAVFGSMIAQVLMGQDVGMEMLEAAVDQVLLGVTPRA